MLNQQVLRERDGVSLIHNKKQLGISVMCFHCLLVYELVASKASRTISFMFPAVFV